ncbi:MFS transporter [Streptomyces rhizosphaericus]|uniref:MFS transporter n=1 Tax=Streptomyces rhizosphaericus TaxID=114699 RepID=A0ABN1NUR4_9ACTN|nr:MFS transporter [Streptomyces cangkringensis]
MRAYAELMRHGSARRLMLASTTGKLRFAIFPLATVLLGHGSSGSFLDAGIVAGAWSVGGTVTAPLRGRLVDRHGQRWPMGVMAVLTALAVAGLVTATATTQLVLSGTLAGASAPPIVASTRSLWARAVPHDLLRGAYALEAVLTEVTKICGPLVAAAAAVRSPRLGVIVAGALLVAGSCLVMSHPPALSTLAAPAPDTGSRGVLSSPALRLLLLTNVCAGICLGALTVGLPARAAESGSAAGAGWMFACLGLGSALAGARFGTRHRTAPPATGYLTTLTWLALLLALLAAISAPPLMALLLTLAGAAFASMTVCLFELLDAHAPRGTAVASMMWMVAGEELGIAAGTMATGALAQQAGTWPTLVLAAAACGLGATITALRITELACDERSP